MGHCIALSLKTGLHASLVHGAGIYRPEKMSDLHCTAISASGPCMVSIAHDCTYAFMQFLEDHPGSVRDFAEIICVASPDQSSQEAVISATDKLVDLGADPGRLRIFLVDAPRDVPVHDAFSVLKTHLDAARYPNCTLDAVLQASTVFDRLRGYRVSASRILRGEIDFARELAEARESGIDDRTLRACAAKLLAQRALLGMKKEIALAFNALKLSGYLDASESENRGNALASMQPVQTSSPDSSAHATERREEAGVM